MLGIYYNEFICFNVFISILAIGGGLGVHLNHLNSYTNLSLCIKNVEALADPDQGGSSDGWDCWSQQDRSALGYWKCGNPCEWVDGYGGSGTSGKCYKNK